MNLSQAFRRCALPLKPHTCIAIHTRRCLSTASSSSSPQPWFIDPSDTPLPKPTTSSTLPPSQPQQPLVPLSPLPSEISSSTPLARLHSRLSASPFLEPGTLLVTKPLQTEVGPPLPPSAPKGRRKRGRTYFGEGLEGGDVEGGLWRWILIAEVRISSVWSMEKVYSVYVHTERLWCTSEAYADIFLSCCPR